MATLRSPFVVCRDVTKQYGGVDVLRSLDLDIYDSERLAIAGGNGSGKSTLLRLIAGLLMPDSGVITINESRVRGPQIGSIGMYFQGSRAYPHMTVRDNLLYPLGVTSLKPRQKDERVHSLAAAFGIDHLLDRRGSLLSGGESQRVALARVLAPSPRVLLMDEPFSGVDQPSRWTILKDLIRVQAKLSTAFVLVTHNPSEIAFFGQRVGILSEGRIEMATQWSDLVRMPPTLTVWNLVNEFPPNRLPLENATDGWVLRIGDTRYILRTPEQTNGGTGCVTWAVGAAKLSIDTLAVGTDGITIPLNRSDSAIGTEGRIISILGEQVILPTGIAATPESFVALHVPVEAAHLFVDGRRLPYRLVKC